MLTFAANATALQILEVILIQKQDLIKVHADLVKIKNNYEKMGYQKEFDEYYDLYITPSHIHKSKDDHQKAIFTLCDTLTVVAEENAVYMPAKTGKGRRTKRKKLVSDDELYEMLLKNEEER
ncbi:UPF0058 family protein [Methanimicrococcus hongohii]|uniref:UPF0058 family protein n=1 Tax=Methanimicrococcus hongohii TaxID=3028295 RepID=UPI00292D008C|nr:UPF0058 family protein [Methanimicrococcus sp. Hf6]